MRGPGERTRGGHQRRDKKKLLSPPPPLFLLSSPSLFSFLKERRERTYPRHPGVRHDRRNAVSGVLGARDQGDAAPGGLFEEVAMRERRRRRERVGFEVRFAALFPSTTTKKNEHRRSKSSKKTHLVLRGPPEQLGGFPGEHGSRDDLYSADRGLVGAAAVIGIVRCSSSPGRGDD